MKEFQKEEVYFDDKDLIEDEYYNGIKDLIKCNQCDKIIKEPMMCMKCQGNFCKSCTNQLIMEKHQCENPTYSENKSAIILLQNLKYLCPNCKCEIKQINIEKHIKEGCNKLDNPTKLMDEIFRKKALRKIDQDEIRELSKQKKNINHITCKLYF